MKLESLNNYQVFKKPCDIFEITNLIKYNLTENRKTALLNSCS